MVALLVPGALWLAAGPAAAVPLLWGIEEDTGTIYSIADYTQIPGGDAAAGLTVYGRLKFDSGGGVLTNVGRDVEALAVGPDGVAYMAQNSAVTGAVEPVFLTFDLATATTIGDNIVDVVGTIGGSVISSDWGSRDNITGLDFDSDGSLYALWRKGDSSVVDHLLIINPLDGSLVSDVGQISGLDRSVFSGESMTFDTDGNLYVTDNQTDTLYRVNPATAEIEAIIDDNEGNGSNLKIEGLAWDPERGVLLASDDDNDVFMRLTFGDGSNVVLGSLSGLSTDLEGLDFGAPIPEPHSAVLFGVGALIVGAALRRRAGSRA